jgi:glycine reductase
MHEENPGAELYHPDVYVVRTGDNAREMAAALGAMLRLARKLRAGEPLGRPEAEGYFPRGEVVLELAEHPAARRAVDMLLAKLAGAPFESEIRLPKFPTTPPPPPIPDLSQAVVALVTDGGLVPRGNPDGIEVRAATKFGVYRLGAAERLSADEYDVTHAGYDNTSVRQDPNRLVPLDVARELEREGRIGRLHDHFISTTGVGTPLDRSRQLGRDIAAHLKDAGVEAVILTST